jgi:signal transduction histidine kinase
MGMAERARLLSGTLEIKSELGKGTRVITRLPV